MYDDTEITYGATFNRTTVGLKPKNLNQGLVATSGLLIGLL
jgi:hypothetical protein